jgi:hypothetical protein
MLGSTITSGRDVVMHVIAHQVTINEDRQSPGYSPKFGPQRFFDVGSHHNHIAFDPGTGYGGWLIGLLGHHGFCGTPRQGLGMLGCGGSGIN